MRMHFSSLLVVACIAVTSKAEYVVDRQSDCHLRVTGTETFDILATTHKRNSNPFYVAVDDQCNPRFYIAREGNEWIIESMESGISMGSIASGGSCPTGKVFLRSNPDAKPQHVGDATAVSQPACIIIGRLRPEEEYELDPFSTCTLDMTGYEQFKFVPTTTRKEGSPVWVAVDDSCNQYRRVMYKEDIWRVGTVISKASTLEIGVALDNWNETCPGNAEIYYLDEDPADVKATHKILGRTVPSYRSYCAVRRLTRGEQSEINRGATCHFRLAGIDDYDMVQTRHTLNGAPVYVAVDQNCEQLSRFVYLASNGEWQVGFQVKSEYSAVEGYRHVGYLRSSGRALWTDCPLDWDDVVYHVGFGEEKRVLGHIRHGPASACLDPIHFLKLDRSNSCRIRLQGRENLQLLATFTVKNGAPVFAAVDKDCNILDRFVYKDSYGEWQIDFDLYGLNLPDGYLGGTDPHATCPMGAKAMYSVLSEGYQYLGDIVEDDAFGGCRE